MFFITRTYKKLINASGDGFSYPPYYTRRLKKETNRDCLCSSYTCSLSSKLRTSGQI